MLSRRHLLLGLYLGVIACGSSTEPSQPATGNSRFPLMSNAGGHLLSPLRLVVVAAANDSLRDSLFAFAKALPASDWWAQVSAPFGISSTATAFTVTGAPIAPGTQLAFTDVENYVERAAIDSAGYSQDGHTVYVMFLPSGVTCVSGGSCAFYSEFHVPFGASDAMAVVTRPPPGIVSALDGMTLGASHEIIEAATDPELNGWKLVGAFPAWTATPWALDDGGNFEENADFCEGTRYLEGGFYYQRIFSNQAAAAGGDPCVPAIAAPYYNVTASQPWFSTNTGDVTVPLTGWSVGATSNWAIFLDSGPRSPSLAAPTYSLVCPDTIAIGAGRVCAINDGKTAMVHITLPAGTPSKSFFSVRVYSERIDANGLIVEPGEDYAHRWIFGVYVP